MNKHILPKISKSKLEENKNEVWDFLLTIVEGYYEIIASDQTGEKQAQFTDFQHTLIAYDMLSGQLQNGGFVQLIHNGYSDYIFHDSFFQMLEKLKMNKTVEVIKKANQIYLLKKDKLTSKTTLEEFGKLYEEIKDFEVLDNEFYRIMDSEALKLRYYIESNLEEFVIIEE